MVMPLPHHNVNLKQCEPDRLLGKNYQMVLNAHTCQAITVIGITNPKNLKEFTKEGMEAILLNLWKSPKVMNAPGDKNMMQKTGYSKIRNSFKYDTSTR